MLPVLDLARLRDIFDDDDEAIVEILQACSTYVRASLVDLDRAAAAGDADGVARAAHGIKGSCANVGAVACEREAARVQDEARAGTIAADLPEAFAAHLRDLEAAIARVVAKAR